jgi:hypothetical protein
MPTIKEFLSNNITVGSQTTESKRNNSSDQKFLKDSSAFKSSLIIKRSQPSEAVQLNDSIKTINLSMVSKGQTGRGTFFLSKASFEDIFERKASPPVLTSRVEDSRPSCPFVLSNSRIKIIPVTPKRRRSSYGSRISLAAKSLTKGSLAEPPRTKRVFSYDWKKDLDDINFK